MELKNFSTERTGEIGRKFLLLLLAGSLLCSARFSLADEATLSAQIAQAIADRQEQLVRVNRCSQGITRYESELAQLQAAASPDAEQIATTEQRLLSFRKCVTNRTRRAENLAEDIAELEQQFNELTNMNAEQTSEQLDALRSAQAARSLLEFKILVAERQIERLGADPVANATRLEQKNAILSSLRAELAQAQDQIADISQNLRQIELNVTLGSQGVAELSWSTPTTRENGTPLVPSEIGGFEIYVVAESTGESVVIVVDDPMAVSHVVDGLAPDTYYFSISAFDSNGQYSQLSEVVSKTVN